MISVFLSTQTWDPASAMIRWDTRCDYSHAGFLDTANNLTFSSMLVGGVAWRTVQKLNPSKMLRLLFPGTDAALSWAQTQQGKRYDWSAIAGMGADRNWRDPNRWFCSELVAAAFEKTGNPLFSPDTTVYRITPRDLLLPTNVQVIG